MFSIDEDLRNGRPAICALDHFGPLARIAHQIGLFIGHALGLKKLPGRKAVTAKGFGIDLYTRHIGPFRPGAAIAPMGQDLGVLHDPGKGNHGHGLCARAQTRLGRGGECGTRSHDIINQKDIAMGQVRRTFRVRTDRAVKVLKPGIDRLAVLHFSPARPKKRIRQEIGPACLGERPSQQGRLIVAPRDKPHPMGWNRDNQLVRRQYILCCAGQPIRGRAHKVQPVGMFQSQHKRTALVFVKHSGPPLVPGPSEFQTIVASHRCLNRTTDLRCATAIASQSGDEMRGAPTGRTKRIGGVDQRGAARALRRVKHVQNRLQLPHGPLVSAVMAAPSKPQLTDRTALLLHRQRAAPTFDPFLHDTAIAELQERLSLVKKTFTNPAIVTGWPGPWAEAWPEAKVVEDLDTLDLAPEAYDLVIHAMALHWADDPVGQIIQCRRAMKPDGLFLAIAPGGETLQELRAVLAEVEARISGGLSPRIAPMGEIRDLGALLQRAGLALPVADSIPLDLSYADLFALIMDLRAMGETNALANRHKSAPPKALFAEAAAHYARAFPAEGGRIRATVELIVLTGWAPDESQPKPLRPGSASQRLADALGTSETPLKRDET